MLPDIMEGQNQLVVDGAGLIIDCRKGDIMAQDDMVLTNISKSWRHCLIVGTGRFQASGARTDLWRLRSAVSRTLRHDRSTEHQQGSHKSAAIGFVGPQWYAEIRTETVKTIEMWKHASNAAANVWGATSAHDPRNGSLCRERRLA